MLLIYLRGDICNLSVRSEKRISPTERKYPVPEEFLGEHVVVAMLICLLYFFVTFIPTVYVFLNRSNNSPSSAF